MSEEQERRAKKQKNEGQLIVSSQAQSEEKSKLSRFIEKKSVRKFLLLAAGVVLVFIITGVSYFSIYKENFLRLSPPIQEEGLAVYESTYWGFGIEYPEEFVAEEVSGGVILANYDRSSRKWNYNPQKSELLVKVLVIDKVFSPSRFPSGESIEKYSDITINGQPVEILLVQDSYPARGPHTYLAAELNHDGFTYRFIAEQSDSIHIQAFLDVLKSLNFIQKDEYLPLVSGFPSEMKLYESTRYGFAFQYPNSWALSDFETGSAFLNTDYGFVDMTIDLLGRYSTLSGDLFEDLKENVSLSCDRNGPTGSTYCPKNQIVIEPYVNKQGFEGYLILRTVVTERGYPDTKRTEKKETLVAYTLPFQEYYAVVFSPTFSIGEEYNEKVLMVGSTFQRLQKKTR